MITGTADRHSHKSEPCPRALPLSTVPLSGRCRGRSVIPLQMHTCCEQGGPRDAFARARECVELYGRTLRPSRRHAASLLSPQASPAVNVAVSLSMLGPGGGPRPPMGNCNPRAVVAV